MVELLTNKQIPLVIQLLSGNTSHKKYFKDSPLTLGKELSEGVGGGHTLIMDSALFNEQNVKAVSPYFH